MKDATKECARYMRKAQAFLAGQQLSVDEATSLLLIERQLQTAIMVSAADARAALIAQDQDAEAMGFAKRRLKSVPAGEMEEETDA